jgi:hypothetical protein
MQKALALVQQLQQLQSAGQLQQAQSLLASIKVRCINLAVSVLVCGDMLSHGCFLYLFRCQIELAQFPAPSSPEEHIKMELLKRTYSVSFLSVLYFF